MESRFVLIVAGSPVESRFVPVCSEVSIYSEVQWSPVESMWIMWGMVKY